MATQLSDPSISVNDITIPVVPNSVEFDEGLGEQSVLVESAGGGQTSIVISNDVETNKGMIKFSMRSTPENIENARNWKKNPGANVVEFSGVGDGRAINRTYRQSAIINNYTVPASADGVIELEFEGSAPTI